MSSSCNSRSNSSDSGIRRSPVNSDAGHGVAELIFGNSGKFMAFANNDRGGGRRYLDRSKGRNTGGSDTDIVGGFGDAAGRFAGFPGFSLKSGGNRNINRGSVFSGSFNRISGSKRSDAVLSIADNGADGCRGNRNIDRGGIGDIGRGKKDGGSDSIRAKF